MLWRMVFWRGDDEEDDVEDDYLEGGCCGG